MAEDKLKPPDMFPFPFEPYPIQNEFMTALYSTLEEGKLGIFESPTGTGKSLSIICGTLCWLQDHNAREKAALETRVEALKKTEAEMDDASDWISGQSRKMEAERERKRVEDELKLITNQEEEMKRMKERVKNAEKCIEEDKDANQIPAKTKENDIIFEDEDLLLEDIDGSPKDDSDTEVEKQEDKYQGVQIIICSRTHSQLSQLVGEVARSPFREVRLVPLASRQSYCVNPAVRKLGSLALINEKCMDLQRGAKGRKTKVEDGATVKKSKKCGGCLYLKAQQNLTKLSEDALVSVQDVESLVEKGKKMSACPYYATRAAVSNAQVVVVPYNTLLHRETREACGLRLRGSVVIIDEAHNLLESIAQVHNAHVTGYQLTHAYSQLVQYRDKYSKRFNATNLLFLEQLIFVVGKLIGMLGGKAGCPPNEGSTRVVDTKLSSLSSFLHDAQIDNINQFRLIEFAQRSKLSHKLHGFSERYQPSVNIAPKPEGATGIRAFLKEISTKSNTPQEQVSASVNAEAEEQVSKNPILPVIAFLQALTSSCEDGRVVISTQASVGRGALKYLLLNPAAHFCDIVAQARSVIVAGGTMQPVSEFQDQLFVAAGADSQRISHFSCGHVIPPDHILPVVLSSGPTNKTFDFSYQNRNKATLMTEFGRTLDNLCNIIPGGIVCFFPSYDYEELVYQHLHKTGAILKLSSRKKVFREPRKSNQVDQVLSEYAAAVKSGMKVPGRRPNGALLFSVVGGKLSEGLNFSDDLGRCVIVVGMPYPNIKSPELQEKMSYLDKTLGGDAGQRHYKNLCMKAVNQSIGRAVRHQGDYAAVLLLDERYSRPSTQALLPSWIQTSLQLHPRVGPAIGAIAKFFAAKRPAQFCQ